MWGLRAQIDRSLYKRHMQMELFENTPNLTIVEGSVDNITLDDSNRCTGVLLGSILFIIRVHYICN